MYLVSLDPPALTLKFLRHYVRRIPSRSFISLIAHGYDAAAAAPVQDDFIAVLGIGGVIFHARNFFNETRNILRRPRITLWINMYKCIYLQPRTIYL